MKKTIKISFSGYGSSFFGFSFYDNYLIDVLKEKYDVEFVDVENADYVFCGIWDKPYEYCDVDQVRIMVQGENYIPDFNFIDYAISSYPLILGDRNFFVPCGVEALIVQNYRHFIELQNRQLSGYTYDLKWLYKKKYFCNLLIGHDSEYNLRSLFFKELSKYKRIESAGTMFNNMPDNIYVNWRDESKIEFQKKCKFTICFESTKHDGFITEKIVDAFLSDTIPIYYGSDIVDEIFNKDRFIRINDINSFGSAIERIIELDNDDEEYLRVLNLPVLNDARLPSQIIEGFKIFLNNIFEQAPNNAYRRSRVYTPKILNDYCSWCSKKYPQYQKEISKKNYDITNSCKRIVRRITGKKLYSRIKSIIKS